MIRINIFDESVARLYCRCHRWYDRRLPGL